MRRYAPTLLAVLSVALLAALTLHFSRTTDAGSADRAARAVLLSAPTIPPAEIDACALRGDGKASGGTDVAVRGACSGAISRPLDCSLGEEEFIGSTRVAVDADHDLVLVVIIPDFIGAKSYLRGRLFAQIAGATAVSRWTNRETPISVDRTGAIHLPPSDLAAEPGTSTTGSIELEGTLTCG